MQIESSPILLALGANLASRHGAPADTLVAAIADIGAAGIAVLRVSRVYVSPPEPPSEQPDYVNAVVAVGTPLAPADLKADLHGIEASYGRRRGAAGAARPLDIDIIDYRGLVLGGTAGGRGGQNPVLPHPRAHRRAFVLKPIADILPGWRHPVSRRPLAELIADLPAGAAPAEPLA
jgi:2-amino-4-hydroxy-6-hydroxymethyldihydropteridine diphosphokinase